jgi:hypothetical protein
MQKINLNLIPGGVCPVVNVSQYDEGRQFQLAIFDGSSSYDLTGKTVTILVGKTDGHGCAYDAADEVHNVPVIAVSGNVVTVTTPIQMTAAAGDNMAEIEIATSAIDIRTLNFMLRCEPAALDPNTPVSDTEIPAIERAGWTAVDHYPNINSGNNHWMVWDVNLGEWVDTGVSAGGGGVTDYNDLSNRPQINGNLLTGNKTAGDLGLATNATMTGATSGTAGAKGLVPAPAAGDQDKCLRGDGSWQKVADTLDDLTDTDISSPTNGQTLVYDDTTNKWKNGAGGGGGSSTLAGLTDVSISAATDKQPLTYDSSSSKWVNGGVIPAANGGTGNNQGYIRAGQKSGSSIGGQATAEGYNVTASGLYAHAEGDTTVASGNYGSHAEGQQTTASGLHSHAEGKSNTASGTASHAEGSNNTVSGGSSHVEGIYNQATGDYQHVGGFNNQAGYDYQTVMGYYNKNESDSLLEIGNGVSGARNNAAAVKSDGRIVVNGSDGLVSGSNIGAVELTKTCANSHAAGSYIYVVSEDKVYRVKSTALQVGTTISSSNCDEVVIGDVLKTLNSDLTSIDTDTTSVTGVTFQRNGHLVNMSSYGGTKANLHGAYVPVKYRPNQEFNAAIYLRDGTNAYMGILSINSSGMIRTTYIATYPADNSYPPNNATCYFNVTYFAD